MTLTRVAFVPSAPLLVPQLAGGSQAADEPMRDAARGACRWLVEGATEVVVVAPLARDGEWDHDATWDFHGFGFPGSPDGARPRLPWQLGIGAWLLDQVGYDGSRRFLAVAGDPPHAPAVIAETARAVVLAVGDGSARRSEKAPGHLDERAAGFDGRIGAALAAGDPAALGALDRALATELMCSGAPVWQAVAGWLDGCEIDAAELRHESTPYGVTYFVATWLLRS